MPLLTPGTGNQRANRKAAVEYIVGTIIEAQEYDPESGRVVAVDGTQYQVSAYAETPAAFVSTPGVDKSKYSIYASGAIALMLRQLKKDKRLFVYEVNPEDIEVAAGSTSAEWTAVDKASRRIWVCAGDKVVVTDKRSK